MRYSILFTCLLSHALAKTDFVPSGVELDLVLREIGDFDLDLVGIEERGDEDVVYLNKRTPYVGDPNQKCEDNDCETWKAWAYESKDYEEFKDSQVSDGTDPADMRRSLTENTTSLHRFTKRGKPKPASICKKTKIDGKSSYEKPIVFESYGYPDNKAVEKKKRVYDYADFDQPNTKEWFEVKNIEKRVDDREYVVEHILEWQMYLRFLQGKKGRTNKENENAQKEDDEDDGEDGGFCKILHEYWKDEIDFTFKMPVKKGSKWVDSNQDTKIQNMKPVTFVGHAYPGGPKVSPYSDEFVIFEHEMNSRKEHIWQGSNISPRPQMSGNEVSKNNKENYKTMQFNLEFNKWWDSKEKTSTKSAKDATKKDGKSMNEGRCQGIGKFRTVLGVYQYHQDKTVQDIFKKQIERVEKYLKHMDEEVLPHQRIRDSNGKTRPSYQPQGLAKKWRAFMKAEIDNRIEKMEEWMETWAKVFKKMKDGDSVKDLGKMFKKRTADDYTNQCGTAIDDEVIDRVKLLLEAYDKRGKWKNPLD